MKPERDEYLPTRLSLLQRLKSWDDQASWQQFFDIYGKMIYGLARRAGLSDADAQDAVQETIIAVAKKLPQFNYDPALGSFKAWLSCMARWRIADVVRERHYQSGGQQHARETRLNTSVMESHPAPDDLDLESAWNEEWEKNILQAAATKVKEQVSAAHYQIFDLHVLKKFSAKEVARRLGVKLAEVYVAKYKVSSLMQKQIKLLEKTGRC